MEEGRNVRASEVIDVKDGKGEGRGGGDDDGEGAPVGVIHERHDDGLCGDGADET